MFLLKGKLIVVVFSFLFISGCASNSIVETNQILGTVVKVESKMVQVKTSGIGGASGALIGGIVGANIGGGNAKYINSALGATGGAIVGNNIEKNMKGYEKIDDIYISLNDGRNIIIPQKNKENIGKNDIVRVVQYSNKTYKAYLF